MPTLLSAARLNKPPFATDNAIYWIGCLMVLAANPVHAEDTETLFSEVIAASLDWRPLALVPDDGRDLRCRQCSGRFDDPLANTPKVDPMTADIKVSANATDVTESEMAFDGGVTVKQGNRILRANAVTFDRTTQIGIAEGDVTLREPGVILISDSAEYDAGRELATLGNAHFALHELQLSGYADQLQREADGDITIDGGTMTFCAPDDPTWVMTSNEIELEPDQGQGEAWGARIKFGDVPVFYLPWVQFPIDDRRKTGLLFPDIGSDTRGGLDVTAPIYLNLAPNYDATYSPRLIGERGLVHQLNGRWLNRAAGSWSVDGAYIGEDEKYRDEVPESEGKRWLIGVDHRGTLGEAWRTQIDYSNVSDPDYIRDLDNNSLSAQRETALLQLGQIDYLGDNWIVNLQAQQFRTLATDIPNNYKKLPQLTAQWRGDANWRGLEPVASLQYSNFDTDALRVTGQRLYAEAGVTYPMSWVYGFLRPTIKYRQLSYDLGDLETTPLLTEARPNAGSGVASLDGGLIFERETTLFGESVTQTLEPRLFYLYSNYTEQLDQPNFDSAELTFNYSQFYRDTRFSGNDRLDDANQLAVGVTTRFYANDTGRERFNASIGQIVYFRDREVRLNSRDAPLTESTSPIALEASWLPSENWDMRASLLYDTYQDDFDAASLQFSHQPGDGRVFNMGYTLREPPPSLATRPVTEQANFSVYYPINDNWRVFGALEYSIEASEAVEDMVGFEYDSCCWQARILYMRYIDTAGGLPDFTDPDLERENALQFQFVLKGMGGFGSRVENLLNDMIRGFDDRYL